jgi:hypothetical protein
MKTTFRLHLATLVLLSTPGIATAYYSAGGDFTLSVRNNQLIRAIPITAQVLARDSAEITGSVPGNFARCSYLADLDSATLGLAAEGLAPLANIYAGGESYVDASASMSDRLQFILPPGDYLQTPCAVLHGWLVGHMGAAGSELSAPPRHSNVQSDVQVYWGSSYGSTNFSRLKYLDAAEGSYALTQELVLSVPLLSAATTNLTVTNIIYVYFSAGTQVRGSALGMYPYGAAETWFLSDFWNGLHFTALEVTAGIAWSSESGVFLNHPDQPIGPLRIRLAGDKVNVVVSWDGPGRLQDTPAVPGGWQTLTNAVSPYTNAVSLAPRCYRLIFP